MLLPPQLRLLSPGLPAAPLLPALRPDCRKRLRPHAQAVAGEGGGAGRGDRGVGGGEQQVEEAAEAEAAVQQAEGGLEEGVRLWGGGVREVLLVDDRAEVALEAEAQAGGLTLMFFTLTLFLFFLPLTFTLTAV